MRKIITIISIVILAACNQQPTGNKTLTELRIKRDSLQNQKFNIEKELNKIDLGKPFFISITISGSV